MARRSQGIKIADLHLVFTATKAISIIFNGEEYKRSLAESLEQIVTTSNALLHQAQNSNMWQNRKVLDVASSGE